MVDGQPVFTTIEEAEAHAKTIGCEGYHEHDLEGQKVYMACKDHSEATDLKKCDCTEKTELESFSEEFGEEMPEGYEVISEEDAVDEVEDFVQRFRVADDYRQQPGTIDTPITYT